MLLVEDQEDKNNIFHYKFTVAGGVVVTLLVLALLALAERVLYDLARSFATGAIDYFDNLEVIAIHAFVIITVLIVSILINFFAGINKKKYAIALAPYFVVSIVLALQLIFQVGVYFYNHHNQIQLYIVMTILVIVTTYAIYYIQKRFNPA